MLARSYKLLTVRSTYRAISRTFASHSGSGFTSYDTNKKTETNRLEKSLSKFWEKVDVAPASGKPGYAVTLDKKSVKTPLGFELNVPENKKSLAYLLANEWRSLPSLQVKPHLLPLTSITARCIDLHEAQKTEDEEIKAKVGDLSTIKTLLLRYLDTDTMLVFSPKEDCDGLLRDEQEKCYRPIIADMEQFFAKFSEDGKPLKFTFLDCEKSGFASNFQTEETKKAVNKYLNSLSTWDLVCLENATLVSKSFLAGVAILRNADYNDKFIIDIEELSRLVNLETVIQTSIWGEVEDTHDVNRVDIKRNLSCASIVAFSSKD
ncbi:hypothetical protein CAS74_000329 [Pichia kudriavzevii]|uniref:Protein ATP12, mitochondrial n=1 Tax=Pichia kudriavzevii TaxID=4909 RepID=A0A1V2LQ58_PICKU|nr:uncharacterized protein C5L36_0C03190 [Pichia kudriavzevii]AWU76379.1 hypothetical protein C5L36_0C03190 [Pichia kudriavzevii]ONH75416.1 Protein ATP12, mitochondrial [Pichia kudriavzevii]OUT23953.1 hypothetical protein CAS74_000329 [Pichia kudriavzevii]